MSKYKVGDKVTVREDLEVDKEYSGTMFVSSMKKLKGRVATIQNVYSGTYSIEEDSVFVWTDEMFEDPTEFPEGCIVYNDYFYRKVLGVCGEVRFLSKSISKYDLNDSYLDHYGATGSVQGLKSDDYKIYTTESNPKPKLTHKQLEEKLGYEFELEEQV